MGLAELPLGEDKEHDMGRLVFRRACNSKFRVAMWLVGAFVVYMVVVILAEFELSEPPMGLDKFVGNIESRLTNPDHALGDGDLRLAFTGQNVDVVEWKLKLVRDAEHSVLFADVMGGQVFDAVVDILETKVKEISHFQVVVLRYAREDSLPRAENPHMTALVKAYPDRVHYFYISLDHFEYPIHYEKVHIKTVIADYGKYFTLGSSVWMDWVAYHDYDSEFVFEDCLGTVGPKLWNDVIDATVAFVQLFSDRYRNKNVDVDALLRMTEYQTSAICAKAGIDACSTKASCSRYRNMTIPVPKPEIYFSGPGQQRNNGFVDALVEAIDKSKSRIVIEHMYFILSDRIHDALMQAAHRGVHILIVSQGATGEKSLLRGLAGVGIGASNDMEAVGILSNGKHVKIYKFIGGKNSLKKTFHKKVVIADDIILAGSPNMGPKSMISFTDLESGFRLHSKALADEYEGIALRDAELYCAGVHGVSTFSFVLAHLWHFIRAFTTFANY